MGSKHYGGALGDGTNTNRDTPVHVVGRAVILAIGAGTQHSLAARVDGTLWAWGEGGVGQIGDGASVDRKTPVAVSDPSFTWKVATPVLSPLGGPFSASVTVTMTCATSGANIHYTLNGVDPTTGDPFVTTGGTVVVGQSLTLKAKAFKTGMPPSNVNAQVYSLTVVAPTFSPVAGTYNASQNVTISTTTTGATIRYTTDGTTPTESSTLYTSPVNIANTTTLKAVGFKTGWTNSTTTSGTYTMKVATPTLSPGGGTYTGAQTVTVSTTSPGAVLHYTTNGVEPTESSPSVTIGGTILVDRALTLKVKGWKSGVWTVSDTAVASYTISLGTVVAPTMTPGVVVESETLCTGATRSMGQSLP